MIDINDISCCLITKEKEYPTEILTQIHLFYWKEILIITESDSPYRKHELFARAKGNFIYYQDDDAFCPIRQLLELSDPTMINVAMKPSHFEGYMSTRMTMGLGWGAIFPKSILQTLKKYTDVYGEDELYKRETERILTYLNFPQNRLVLPIYDLPSAYAADRLWRQPIHQSNIALVAERCAPLVL